MAAVPAPASATFAALFSDASKDPFSGTYAASFAPFDISPAGVNVTPETVRQQIAAASNQRLPLAIALLVEGRIRPFFLPFRRDQAMGAPADPSTDGKFFAYDGELIHGQGSLVEVPSQWFNLTNVVHGPTVDNIRAAIAASNDPSLLMGPFQQGDPDTMELRARSTVVLPHKYVGLFLSQLEGITPHYYFETILPVIEADGLAVDCAPLTRFCQMAITRQTANGAPLLEVATPIAPRRHVPLLTQAHGLLAHHLPALLTPSGAPVNLQSIVDTITAYTMQRQAEKAQAALDKVAKTNATVATWLGPESFGRLLRYCSVANEVDLPPIWSALAQAPAKDRLAILQGKVRNELISLGAVFEQFTVSLSLLTELTSLRWAMINADALETGSLGNAFLFTDSDVEEMQGLARTIDLIQTGGASPSLADATTLLKMKVTLPGADDSLRCLLRMHAVYRAVLPVGHPLTAFIGNHYDIMKAFDPGWTHYATHIPALRALKGVFHLQWLSLRLTKYFTQHDRGLPTVTLPDPNELVDCIQSQTQWEPNLTPAFADRYNLRAFLGLHAATSPASVVPSLVSASTMTGASSLSQGTTGSSAPAPITAPAPSTAGVRLENTHFNTALFGTYKTSSIKSRDIRRKVERGDLPPLPPSKMNASKPVCLAWHTKGQCNSNCPCLLDHVAYTPDEYAPLVAWCRDHGYRSE